MRRLVPIWRPALLMLIGVSLTGFALSARPVWADGAGWRQMTVPGSADTAAIHVSLYYPTEAAARAITMGLFTVNVAIQGPLRERVRGLIVISHGTGGSEFNHSSLAEALAKRGYLVAALRHPGDNWQDRSLWSKSPDRYFAERPAQVTRVIDALLADPAWKHRISADAQGPKIGAIGHSAGGYTVIALAGGQADLQRIVEHCQDYGAEDPIFCDTRRANASPRGQSPETPSPRSLPPVSPTLDKRVRAVVALAPLGVVFTWPSLTSVQVPVSVHAAGLDRWLVPRFHADWIARNLPRATLHREDNASHFAFMDPPSAPILTPDGDAAADPSGFNRRAFLQRLQAEIGDFFDRVFADPS